MNVIERTVLLARGDLIQDADVQLSDNGGSRREGFPEPHEGFDVQVWLDESRRLLFQQALERSAGNASAAARLLGVTPQAVSKFVNESRTGPRKASGSASASRRANRG